MSKSITIRNVPEETRDELAARAARGGQSLQEYLRVQLIALAERPDNPALWQQRAELLGEMTNRYQAGNWQRHLRLASY